MKKSALAMFAERADERQLDDFTGPSNWLNWAKDGQNAWVVLWRALVLRFPWPPEVAPDDSGSFERNIAAAQSYINAPASHCATIPLTDLDHWASRSTCSRDFRGCGPMVINRDLLRRGLRTIGADGLDPRSQVSLKIVRRPDSANIHERTLVMHHSHFSAALMACTGDPEPGSEMPVQWTEVGRR